MDLLVDGRVILLLCNVQVLALGRCNFENSETTEISCNVDKLEFSVRFQEIYFCYNSLDSFMYNSRSVIVFQILIH